MIRLIFLSVLVLHGLLHFVGFAKEWNIGSQGELTGKAFINLSANSSRFAGTLWLITGFLFLAAAVLYLFRKEWFWMPAALALLTSQTLIIIYWQDARYGTIVNLAILFVVIYAAGVMLFNRGTVQDVVSLQSRALSADKVITRAMLDHLPRNVQLWLHKAGVVENSNPNVIRILQKGNLRSKPDGEWMPFRAVQYFSIDPPSFVWDARIQASPLLEIAARDKFEEGNGFMLIKPMYIFTAAKSSGKEINQGTMLRFLAEMAWFPQAALSPYLRWEGINERQAKVTMTYNNLEVSGIYSFDEAGHVTGFEARRYGDFDGIYRKETWSVSVTGYKTFNNRLIGNASEVTWKLKEGDFKWLVLEVTEIE